LPERKIQQLRLLYPRPKKKKKRKKNAKTLSTSKGRNGWVTREKTRGV